MKFLSIFTSNNNLFLRCNIKSEYQHAQLCNNMKQLHYTMVRSIFITIAITMTGEAITDERGKKIIHFTNQSIMICYLNGLLRFFKTSDRKMNRISSYF